MLWLLTVNNGTINGTVLITVTIWLFNIAMENGPFIDGLPIKNMVDLSMANC